MRQPRKFEKVWRIMTIIVFAGEVLLTAIDLAMSVDNRIDKREN
jgi:hypothetical protein